MRPSAWSRLFGGLLALTLLAAPAAASIRVVTDAHLAAASAAAVHGRVVAIAVRKEPAADAIYTYVTLDVWQAWGMPVAPARVVLKQLGGQLGQTALHIGGQAEFELGEDVFVFVDVRPRDGTLYVAGLEQGKWSIRGDTTLAGSPAAVRESHPFFVPQSTVVDRRGLLELETMARSVAGAPRRFVVDPPELAELGPASPSYEFFAAPARWHEADSGQPMYIDSQSGGHPHFPGGGLTQLNRAIAMWRDASSLNAQPGVFRGPRCRNQPSSDGRISVTYGDPCGDIADGSSTLAIGGYWLTGSDMRTRGGISFSKIVSGFIVIDNAASKFQNMSLGCYEQMLAHEIGHAIGFDHSTSGGAIMRPVISGCGGRTTSNPLSADELAGLAVAYPRATPPPLPLPGAPASFAASATGSTLVASWSAASGQVSEYVLEAGTTAGATDIGTLSTGLQTSFSAPVAAGRYYLRVRARNASGLGPASSEASVLVGAATPPPPPQGFVATSAGGTVTLQWTAPVGGAPLGYQVEAGSQPGLANIAVFSVSGTSLMVGGVPPGVYYVRVRALGPAGASAPSTEATLVIQPPGLPGAPSGLTWSVDAGRTVTLAWSAPVAGAAPLGYALEAGSMPGLADIVAPAFIGQTTSYVVPNVPPGTYFVRIRAVNAAGMGAASDEVLVVVP